MNVKVSDVKLALTEVQYGMLMALSQSIPRILTGAPDGAAQAEPPTKDRGVVEQSHTKYANESAVDLHPELDGRSGSTPRATLDLVLTVTTVKLQLYDRRTTVETSLKDHGIARFALCDNSVRVKMLSDGAMEAQVVLRSFTMSNTAPGPSKFREIIPAAKHERNQFMLLYTMSGGPERSALAVLTVDSPHILFSLAPVFALTEFFTSAFGTSGPVADYAIEAPKTLEEGKESVPSDKPALFQFRIDLHDVSISVLENDLDPDSQAIRLTVAQISLSQQVHSLHLCLPGHSIHNLVQGILALTLTRAGMALLRMGRPEEARILDDVDLTLALDNRTMSSHQMTSIDITFKPIILRASYRDIMLILTIVNKVMEAYGKLSSAAPRPESNRPSIVASTTGGRRMSGGSVQVARSDPSRSTPQPLGTAHVVLSKEQVGRTDDRDGEVN